MTKILVVEDDKAINGLVCAYLRENGYQPTACFDGEEALTALEDGQFSMIISDIMMPKKDGFTLAEEIRLTDKTTPILFMSAKDDKPSKLYAYKLGIDDYVVKPFDMDVFMLKVAALLRRAGIENSRQITVGNLTMNADEHTAYLDGEELPLTVREFDLLFKFLSYPKKTFTRSLVRNFGFRTMLFAVGSYAASIAFGIFNGVIGILSRSIWYGALAAYYILLAFLRGGVLSRHGKSRAAKKAGVESVDIEYTNAKNYRGCGVLLLLLNLALSGAIAQMIFDDGHFSYAGWTVYAMAAYAFFKITMSVINIFRAKKQKDMTVRAVRNINFADALVSILALQTALLTTFSGEGVDVSLFNTLTGCAVSLLTLGLGVLMIITGNQKMKEIRENKQNNGR